MESTAQDVKFSLKSMAINGIKVTGDTLNPHFMWIQEQMPPSLKHFLNWKHFTSTGFMFTTIFYVLWTLHYWSVVYIVSFSLLALLMISSMLWLFHIVYKMCIQFYKSEVYKSEESKCLQHPLKPYFDKQTKICVTEVHRVVDDVIQYVDIIFKRYKDIILVENLLKSAVAWCLLFIISIYCGTTMPAVTVLKWIVICVFIISLPFGYIEHKATIDPFCIHVLERIQHSKRLNCNNDEESSATDEGHKVSLSERMIMKFSSVMFLFRLEWKMIYYLIVPMIISVISSLLLCLFEVQIPHIEPLTGKRSFLNQLFVKFGWGWTLSMLLLFQFCLISIYRDRWRYLRNIAFKTFFTTLFFYVWCQIIFPFIEEFNGECKHNENIVDISKRQCLKNPEHKYMSHFDISGHAYLMSYCVLILMQEAQQVDDLLKALRHPGKHEKLVPHAPQFAAPLVAISFILITILAILWDFMIIVTMTYFHTFIEIILGVLLAILMFNILYEKILPYFLSL